MSVEFRICENWLWNDSVDTTTSSEDPSFPATNLTEFLRAKVWRSDASGGTFIVTTSNQSMDFDEGGGELTATIPAATYSASSLATEIKTQLDAAGGDTYTVSYSISTGKWTIASDGGTLSLLTLTGTNIATSVWSSIGFDVASDHTGALTYTGANIAIHTEERITMDLKSIENVDSFALLFNPLQGVKFSSAAVLKLEANATTNWSSPAVSETLTIDEANQMALHFFSSDETYRFWSLKMVDPENANLYVEVPKIVLSDSTRIAHGPQNEFSYRKTDLTRAINTEFGHRYYDTVDIEQTFFDFDFALFTDTELEDIITLYQRVGTNIPVFLCIDPTETILDKERYSVYGNFEGSLDSAHVVTDIFNSGLAIREQM